MNIGNKRCLLMFIFVSSHFLLAVTNQTSNLDFLIYKMRMITMNVLTVVLWRLCLISRMVIHDMLNKRKCYCLQFSFFVVSTCVHIVNLSLHCISLQKHYTRFLFAIPICFLCVFLTVGGKKAFEIKMHEKFMPDRLIVMIEGNHLDLLSCIISSLEPFGLFCWMWCVYGFDVSLACVAWCIFVLESIPQS